MPTYRHSFVQTAHAFACLLFATGFLVKALAQDIPTDASATPTPKTHVLFIGADIAVEKDKSFHKVEDVTTTALVIRPDGRELRVPIDRAVKLRISESLKLAESSVAIEDLKTERAYTEAADPFLRLVEDAAVVVGQEAAADLARGTVLHLESTAGTEPGPEMQAMIAKAHENLATVSLESTRQVYDMGGHSADSGAEAAEKMYDAIRVNFDVTPERELRDAYYAVIAIIRERGSKPGQVRKWTYLKSLGSMRSGETSRVAVYQGGLPPGYELESCVVHIFEKGSELATNLSRKRVELTDEEALEYRIIEYVGANKGRTLAASLAPAPIPAAVRASLSAAPAGDTCYVSVAVDGRVTAVFKDAARKQPLADAALVSALQSLRFNPALENGKPVESLLRVAPRQLASS